MLLGMLSKEGLKLLIGKIAKTAMFQEFIQGLIMERVKGLKDTYPETYSSIQAYTIAVSRLPAILTDDDPNNLEQIAVAFRLKQLGQLEETFEDASNKAVRVLTATKKARIRVQA